MNKKSKMLIGTSSFKELVVESDVFVDKSLFIQEILDTLAEVILFTRSRRWGKSLGLDILRPFLEWRLTRKVTKKMRIQIECYLKEE